MRAKLIIEESGGKREEEITDYVMLGRSKKNKICVKDPHVSRKHCLIFYDKKRGYLLQDLGSTNGTFINKHRISRETVLREGDEIMMGGTVCTFTTLDTSGKLFSSLVDFRENDPSTYISASVSPGSQTEFQPENEVSDERVLRADYEKLRVTYELQRSIGLEMNIDQLLERILDRTFEFLDYDRALILVASNDGILRPRICKSKREEKELVFSNTLVNYVREKKTAVLSLDTMTDDRFKEAKSILIQGVRSTMGVPILHQDELLGIMFIDSYRRVNAYTEKDLQLLTNIANQAAQMIKNSQMAKKIERDALTRDRFQRLLSPHLADLVVSGELSVEKGGENRMATVLFVDIRGFTSISEHMEASEVLQMLNAFFEVMVDVVFRYDGTVDKFLGDGMMVLWGAPVKQKNHAYRSVLAALDMLEALRDFNSARRMRGENPVEIGVGINSGDLVAGYMGSSRTMSYSVVGDTVNTASRLCSAAKSGQIIISESSFSQVKELFEVTCLDPITAKGKQDPIKAYQITGLKKANPEKRVELP